MNTVVEQARFNYHKTLFETDTITMTESGLVSIADSGSNPSKKISSKLIEIMKAHGHDIHIREKKLQGQTSGAQFEEMTARFLQDTFPLLQPIRPGNWHILRLGNTSSIGTSDFAQYEHLAYLNAIAKADEKVRAALGNDYVISPDIVIYKDLYHDAQINSKQAIVDEKFGRMSCIRIINGGKPVLHASVSAKITMRSDRAQNSRTEALNLIRNRKGNLPHIDVVTCEPTPNRISSLALGTGDVDCVYHFALPELIQAINEVGSEDAKELLDILIHGKRLKDISDLPLDLAV